MTDFLASYLCQNEVSYSFGCIIINVTNLGLKIPPTPVDVTSAANSPCRARVVNEYFTWEDGKMQIFDDSFDHEVWQLDPLKRSRLILIMDMAHPELTVEQLAAL